MKLAITTDHAGFKALQELRQYLESLGHECVDYGPTQFVADDDYPDFIFPAVRAVADGTCERAIIMGGSGQGEAIAANRFKNIRCALFYGPAIAKSPVDAEGTVTDDPYEIVRLSRLHNDANVLSLSGRFLTTEQMQQACSIWLETEFSHVARHERRIAKLATEGS